MQQKDFKASPGYPDGANVFLNDRYSLPANRRDEGSDDQTYAKAGDQAADKYQRRSGKKKEAYAQS